MTGLLCGVCILGRFLTIPLIEAVDPSGGIDQLLFPGKERVASRANFYVQVALLSRTCLKSLTARTRDGHFLICWMNLWLHYFPLLSLCPVPIVSNLVLSANKP